LGGFTINVLECKSVSKWYGDAEVLKSVDFNLAQNEIHAIVGENGAGKSTLVKIISGLVPVDVGTIKFEGNDRTFSNIREIQNSGVALIHQEPRLFPDLSVLENVCVDYQVRDRKSKRFNWKQAEVETKELLAQLGCSFSVHSPVKALSVADQQMVDMVSALRKKLKLLIVDEPTASLTPSEVARLFETIRKLNASGVAIIFIGHRLEEVLQLSDRITVLKDGEIVAVKNTSETTEDELIRLMVGRNISASTTDSKTSSSQISLKVSNLVSPGYVADVSFEVKRGEILGIGGLVGAGRSELLETIFGLRKRSSGEVISTNHGSIKKVKQAISSRIALVPEDRSHNGLFLNRSINENLVITNLNLTSRGGKRNFVKEKLIGQELIEKFRVKLSSASQLVRELSGGNQQKVSLAKWLKQDVEVLLIDEPSRGVDVGSKSEIHQFLNNSAKDGMSIIMVSSDMRELIELSHRIIVMRNGRIAGELSGSEISEESVLRLASGLATAGKGH
jgi:ABC-type sugar transport system ATPase subunit